jgi:uncharacterized protein (TIGR00255 family)
MLQSMTAFASYSSYHHAGELTWEIKSTNHRYLEIYFKMPDEFRAIEYDLREIIKQNFSRGKIECFLSFAHASENLPLKLNIRLLEQLNNVKDLLAKNFNQSLQLDLLQLLNYPGLIDSSSLDQDMLCNAVKQAFAATTKLLLQDRARAGTCIYTIINEKVLAMHALLNMVIEDYPLSIDSYIQKLRSKLSFVDAQFEERIGQELTCYLQKSDIAEELERLQMHLLDVTTCCDIGGVIGRKLDFLMQELNREANTLGAKSVSKVISKSAIELKVLIEQIREQVQNLE